MVEARSGVGNPSFFRVLSVQCIWHGYTPDPAHGPHLFYRGIMPVFRPDTPQRYRYPKGFLKAIYLIDCETVADKFFDHIRIFLHHFGESGDRFDPRRIEEIFVCAFTMQDQVAIAQCGDGSHYHPLPLKPVAA